MEFNKEFEELQSERDCILARFKETESALKKKSIELEAADREIEKLKGQIKFFEGQIVAYKYSINCKR